MKTAWVKMLAGAEGGRTFPFYGKVYSSVGQSLAVEGEDWSVKVYFEATNLPQLGKWCVAGVRMLSEKAPEQFLTDCFTLFEGRKRTLMGIPILENTMTDNKPILRGLVKAADKADDNGNFWPRTVLEKAVEDYNKRSGPKWAVIRDSDTDGPFETRLQDVACEIQMEMAPEGIVAEVTKISDTPKGRRLQFLIDCMKNGLPADALAFGVRGTGTPTVRPDGIREIGPDFKIDSVSILPSKDKA